MSVKSLADQLFDVDYEILQLKDRLEQLYPIRSQLFLGTNEQNYKDFKWLVVNPNVPQWNEKFEEWFSANTNGGISLDGYYMCDKDAGIPYRAAFQLALKQRDISYVDSICAFLDKYVGDIPAHNIVCDTAISEDMNAVVFHALDYTRETDEYVSETDTIYLGFVPEKNAWIVADDTHWGNRLSLMKKFDSARDALDFLVKTYLTA